MKNTFNPLDNPEINKLLDELLESLFKESGRGALLIATTHVDDHLISLLKTIMPPALSKPHQAKLFKYPGPISSFSAKN